MYKRSRKNWTKHLDFFVLDALCIFIAFILAETCRFGSNDAGYSKESYQFILVIFIISEMLASLFLNNLDNVVKRGYYLELINILTLSFLTVALTALILYASKQGEQYSRLLILYSTLIFIPVDYFLRNLWKLVVRSNLKLKKAKNNNARSCFILSDSKNIDSIVSVINNDIYDNFVIKGIALLDDSSLPSNFDIPVCSYDEASKFICREWIDEVFVYLPDNSTQPKEFLDTCMEMGVTLHSVLNLKKVDDSKQFIESLDNHVMITSAFNYISTYQIIIKRFIDILGGIIGSVFAILIGIVIGPLIYFNSPGPIIFKQIRIGKNGKPFNVLKFRSMYLDAEEKKQQLMDDNILSSDLMFKLDKDPRIIGNVQLADGTWKTGIGDFIRRTSLDEFPQFFNVLKGDMSLVGTRPPTVDEWNKYEYHHRARMAVKPGITGLWQISGRNEITDFEEVVKLDTQYIVDFRISQDIKILLKTILVVFNRKGAM